LHALHHNRTDAGENSVISGVLDGLVLPAASGRFVDSLILNWKVFDERFLTRSDWDESGTVAGSTPERLKHFFPRLEVVRDTLRDGIFEFLQTDSLVLNLTVFDQSLDNCANGFLAIDDALLKPNQLFLLSVDLAQLLFDFRLSPSQAALPSHDLFFPFIDFGLKVGFTLSEFFSLLSQVADQLFDLMGGGVGPDESRLGESRHFPSPREFSGLPWTVSVGNFLPGLWIGDPGRSKLGRPKDGASVVPDRDWRRGGNCLSRSSYRYRCGA
jgi:hypothetical protein